MLAALVIGIFATTAVTVAVATFTRSPTHALCPECHGRTKVVMLPPVLRRNRFVHMRWCPKCEWEGLGRNGPEWVKGRRVAHRSGFHWGRARFRSDFGFRFRPLEPVNSLPPHHPSGFRFAEDELTPTADHPSGFQFADDDSQLATKPTFRWARPVKPGDFQFKERDEGSSDGFNWKGVA